MAVRPGYVQTEIGVIPKDWEERSLEDLNVDISDGNYSSKYPKASEFRTSGIPFIRANNIQNMSVVDDDLRYISQSLHAELKKGHLKRNDVLVTTRGEIGQVAFVPDRHIDSNINAQLVRIGTGNSAIDSCFLGCFLASRIAQKQFENLQTGSALKQLPVGKLITLRVLLPPTKAEQKAIAGALSDADALIESLDALVAKKRQIKQGAMQELLTGNTRLPGFSGKWQHCLLGEFIEHCSSGATPYRGRSEYYNGTVKWITSGELNYGRIMDTLEHLSEQAVKDTNLRVHPAGTFLMAITGLEAVGTRGSCGIVGNPATTNQSCMAIYPNNALTTDYLFHYYVYRGDELALRYCQGTKQQSYTAKLVRLLPIDLPPTSSEQEAISSLLSDMDTEINALETKLAKARQIKQGMMQELLTGRIRLV